MPEINHLSYSSISAYLACGAAWKYKYLDGLKTSTTPELIFGSAWHNTIESFIGSDHQADLLATWSENWARQANQEVDWGTDTPEHFCNEGVRLLSSPEIQKGLLAIRASRDAEGPRIERKVELHVPGVPLPVIGYIDIITADGIPGGFKTSKSSWSLDKALGETQPLFYLAALNQAGGQTPGWRFRHFIFVKTKESKFQAIEHIHNPGQLFWVFSMIQKIWNGISCGVFPENPTGWKCSALYCDFWKICRGKYE